jgi:hypothetical protein
MSYHPEAIERFPLAWPAGWVRTPAHKRTAATFSTKATADRRLTVFAALQRLEGEVDRLGAVNPTLSSNVPLRLDGRPRSDAEPPDVGVAIYFTFRGKATVFACDKYRRVADNIAAIAAHIDALRRIERYGVGSLEQALAGYKALPADTAADWRAVMGFPREARVTASMIDARYIQLARERHPDAGGSDIGFHQLSRAKEFALRECAE